jgi:hypothetical protein
MSTIQSRSARALVAAATTVGALLLAAAPAVAADAPVLHRSTTPAAARDLAPAATFTVTLINLSNVTFDEAVVALSRKSTPGVRLLPQRNIAPMTVRQWDLGACADVKSYALGIYVDGELVGSTGNVTPDATDGDLCGDEFEIG